MLRITLGGDALSSFPVDEIGGYVKLFLQDKGEQKVRTYTVRNFNPELLELDLDFVMHEATGPAAWWAQHCKVGEEIDIGGPGPKKMVDKNADWYLLAGDMSALPALSVNLEALPADAIGYAIIEIISENDQQELSIPKGIDVQWLVNPHPDANNNVMFDAVKACKPKSGTPYFWVAGEFAQSIKIRKYLKTEYAIDRRNIYASSYWQIGQTEDGHKINKRNYANAVV